MAASTTLDERGVLGYSCESIDEVLSRFVTFEVMEWLLFVDSIFTFCLCTSCRVDVTVDVDRRLSLLFVGEARREKWFHFLVHGGITSVGYYCCRVQGNARLSLG